MTELTKTEKNMILAYRLGANVKVTHHGVDNADEAMLLVGQFGGVTDIIDLTDNEVAQFVAFQNNEHDRLEVNAFVNVDK